MGTLYILCFFWKLSLVTDARWFFRAFSSILGSSLRQIRVPGICRNYTYICIYNIHVFALVYIDHLKFELI